jgi:hypothetical protein
MYSQDMNSSGQARETAVNLIIISKLWKRGSSPSNSGSNPYAPASSASSFSCKHCRISTSVACQHHNKARRQVQKNHNSHNHSTACIKSDEDLNFYDENLRNMKCAAKKMKGLTAAVKLRARQRSMLGTRNSEPQHLASRELSGRENRFKFSLRSRLMTGETAGRAAGVPSASHGDRATVTVTQAAGSLAGIVTRALPGPGRRSEFLSRDKTPTWHEPESSRARRRA